MDDDEAHTCMPAFATKHVDPRNDFGDDVILLGARESSKKTTQAFVETSIRRSCSTCDMKRLDVLLTLERTHVEALATVARCFDCMSTGLVSRCFGTHCSSESKRSSSCVIVMDSYDLLSAGIEAIVFVDACIHGFVCLHFLLEPCLDGNGTS